MVGGFKLDVFFLLPRDLKRPSIQTKNCNKCEYWNEKMCD